ncbi:dihydroneopterin aldolase [Salinisphaera sp. USBA-960]|uniref:dihydroneopterin aldolase n=1 Tax=Salinisphaera orenii TaxID=856731 RepID=UPI000DBE392C|nr:dihydroneopterin aldolase [Salifodinibacter halophilus]NNC27085.1 dihydroneopterin aldolase [Salifodinibacter halophilus]
MDTVFIRGLEVAAIIGIHDAERHMPQRLRIDLALNYDTRAAAASDVVADTLDYQQISSDLQAFVESTRYQLVETLANRIAEKLLRDHSIEALTLTLTKPDVMAPDVGVTIERSQKPGA